MDLLYSYIEGFDNYEKININIHIIFKYIFKTSQELAKGLMFQRNLPKDEGALFIMKENKIQKFWMKNTFIPLDMIFLDINKKIIGFRENAIPHDLTSYSIDKPSKYVIEVNAGFVDRHNLQIGDNIIF
tara:strand:- start:275 stop:661 length:387 start_codon:yes stop_codon:yes gene_type:complete